MPDRLPPRTAALVAGGAALGVAALHRGLVASGRGRDLDDRVARAAARPDAPRRAARALLLGYRLASYGVVVSAVGLLGLWRRAIVRTACASGALLGTVATAEALKASLHRPVPPIVDRDDHPWPENSYPSGHTAGVAALTAMALVLAPPNRRAVAAGGAGATAVVGAATVAARWHRPSDVAGAALVALGWGAVALAAADALDPR